MIKLFKHSTMIYIDHDVNLIITVKTKFNITNINKVNLKLIKTLTYIFQFRFEIRHCFDRFNVISDIFSKLSTIKKR